MAYIFKYFNRCETWVPVAKAFNSMKPGSLNTPPWSELRTNLDASAQKGLFKPFSIPLTARLDDVPEELLESDPLLDPKLRIALPVWKTLWNAQAFESLADVLHPGITTSGQYDQFYSHLESLATSVKGAFGIYKRKNFLDILIAVGVLPSHVITKYQGS